MAKDILFRIGARGSPLSRAQVARVTARMAAAFEIGAERIDFIPITTSGDRIQDRALIESGGKGLFTKELDEALLDFRIDLAVHSMKDLPSFLPSGISLACVPEREDPRDAFVSLKAETLDDLPDGATIGTSSVRRQAQVLQASGGMLKVTLLRGNVDTRLKKLEEGVADATFLALAGLKRLGLEHHARSLIDPIAMPPAACQGALALTARAEDAERYAAMNDPRAWIETSAERAFLAALDGSCRTPIGAYSRVENGELTFLGELLRPDGSEAWRAERTLAHATPAKAAALGDDLGQSLAAVAREEGLNNP